MPGAPFSVVAQAPGAWLLTAFPLDDGSAILAGALPSDLFRTLRLAIVGRDDITPAPALASGLPAAALSTTDLPLVAGHYPDALWLVVPKTCDAYQWSPAEGRWSPRPPKRPPTGECGSLAAWTPGAALAATLGPNGPGLVAFGTTPKALPALPPRLPVQPSRCASRVYSITSLFAFPTGEVTILGSICDDPSTLLAHWPAGAARADVLDTGIGAKNASFVLAHTRDEIALLGVGALGPWGREAQIKITFRTAPGRLQRTSIGAAGPAGAPEPLAARWHFDPEQELGLPTQEPARGFTYDGYTLTGADDVLVFAHVERRGQPDSALVLRSRPVQKALVLP
jgi:hypothetical protein